MEIFPALLVIFERVTTGFIVCRKLAWDTTGQDKNLSVWIHIHAAQSIFEVGTCLIQYFSRLNEFLLDMHFYKMTAMETFDFAFLSTWTLVWRHCYSMNIIILYLSVWSFVAVVVFLSISSQIMYSTDMEHTSAGTRHGKSPTNIFQSPIDDENWDLSDKRMIVIYVYPGYNAEYMRRLLCDMHDSVCADLGDIAYCMRRRHLYDMVNTFSKCSEKDILFYLCLLNTIFKKSGMEEICLDTGQSAERLSSNFEDLQFNSDEDLIPVDKFTYQDKKKAITEPSSQFDTDQQTIDIHENPQTSNCVTKHQVRYHCMKHNVVLFSNDEVMLHALVRLDLPSLRILHVLPPQPSVMKAPRVSKHTLLSAFAKFSDRVSGLHSYQGGLCERFHMDMVALESISTPLRHRSYRTMCPDRDELQKLSFKIELLNFLDLYLPEEPGFIIHNSHVFNSAWGDNLGRKLSDECMLRWKRLCGKYRR